MTSQSSGSSFLAKTQPSVHLPPRNGPSLSVRKPFARCEGARAVCLAPRRGAICSSRELPLSSSSRVGRGRRTSSRLVEREELEVSLARALPRGARGLSARHLGEVARTPLLPVRYSCPLAFPTRLLLLLASLLAPFVARYSFVAKYEHARYPYVANHEHPPGTGTTRGASTPGHGHYPGCEHPQARALPGVRPRATPVLLVPLSVHVLVPVSVLSPLSLYERYSARSVVLFFSTPTTLLDCVLLERLQGTGETETIMRSMFAMLRALPFFVEGTLLPGSNDLRHLSSSGCLRHLLSFCYLKPFALDRGVSAWKVRTGRSVSSPWPESAAPF